MPWFHSYDVPRRFDILTHLYTSPSAWKESRRVIQKAKDVQRAWQDSNLRHTAPETVALSPELQAHIGKPANKRFSYFSPEYKIEYSIFKPPLSCRNAVVKDATSTVPLVRGNVVPVRLRLSHLLFYFAN